MQKYGRTGVQGHRSTGAREHGSTGAPEHRPTVVLSTLQPDATFPVEHRHGAMLP